MKGTSLEIDHLIFKFLIGAHFQGANLIFRTARTKPDYSEGSGLLALRALNREMSMKVSELLIAQSISLPHSIDLRLLDHLIERMEEYDQSRLDSYEIRRRARFIDPLSSECTGCFFGLGMVLLFIGTAIWTMKETFETSGCLGEKGARITFSCSNMNHTWATLCDNTSDVGCELDCVRVKQFDECSSSMGLFISGGVLGGIPLLCCFLSCFSYLCSSLRGACSIRPSVATLSMLYPASSEELKNVAILFRSQLTRRPSYSHAIDWEREWESDVRIGIKKLSQFTKENLTFMRAIRTSDDSALASRNDTVLTPLLGGMDSRK